MIATHVRLLLCPAMLLVMSACKTIAPETSMPTGSQTPPPAAYQELCNKDPEACLLPLTGDFEASLQAAHRAIKATVIPTEEEADEWSILEDVSAGDCEDFALTLRQALRQSFPEYGAAFLLATAFTEQDDYHAVLTVETSKGTMVCDIRFAACLHWSSLRYSWHLREVAGQRHWEDIGSHETRARLATASIAN